MKSIRILEAVLIAIILGSVRYGMSTAKTVRAFASEQSAHEAIILKNISVPETPQEYIVRRSNEIGVNPALSICIVKHESNFLDVPGDHGNSVGPWQISMIWHPEVATSTSHSLAGSTTWALLWIKNGHVKEWSTYALYCSHIPLARSN